MKKLILIILILGILGGGGTGALWYLKLPPFKKAKTAAVKQAQPVSTATVNPSAPAPSEPTKPEKAEATAALKTDVDKPEVKEKPKPPEFTDEGVTKLAAVYSQMPIDTVKDFLPKLPDTVVYALLTKLDEKLTGKFLAAMPVERASKLSLALARGIPPSNENSAKSSEETTLKKNSR